MYGNVIGGCLTGIEGEVIRVEVDISNGLPQMTIVGLPDLAVRESLERVRAAIRNCRFQFPMDRITVNLAPADMRKEGTAFDLAIAAGILSASGQIRQTDTEGTLLIGELSLNGEVRPVPGVLSMVHSAWKNGIRHVVVPKANAREASLIVGVDIRAIGHLTELSAPDNIERYVPDETINDINDLDHKINSDAQPSDFVDVTGQQLAKRALVIAAAGMHNILLIGPPGTGKTMLLRRLPSIMPALSDEESLEVMKIYSVAGKLPDRSRLIRDRPFRSPHHTVSTGGLIGGGPIPKPGEASMAHRGILFLDELPEFARNALEVLRQPLEERVVTISRARASYTFPAHFMLAAAMNPCPCGYYGAATEGNACSCGAVKVRQYRGKLSGPLLDRIDLHVDVPRFDMTRVSGSAPLGSADMKRLVEQARTMQEARFEGSRVRFNSELTGKMLRETCRMEPQAERSLQDAFQVMSLSLRSYDRVLKIARTIADLDLSETIRSDHISEAVQYRALDRTYA